MVARLTAAAGQTALAAAAGLAASTTGARLTGASARVVACVAGRGAGFRVTADQGAGNQ
jgi:hypothetical protein